MCTPISLFRTGLAVALAAVAATSFAGDKRTERSQRENDPGTTTRDIVTPDGEPTLGFTGPIDRPKFYDPDAELEATSVEFQVDYHFGADVWYDHRVVARITNIDTVWSSWYRTWKICGVPPNSQVYVVDTGMIPPLAPGESYEITRYLPASVGLDDAFYLGLSPGDANPGNDSAIDLP